MVHQKEKGSLRFRQENVKDTYFDLQGAKFLVAKISDFDGLSEPDFGRLNEDTTLMNCRNLEAQKWL